MDFVNWPTLFTDRHFLRNRLWWHILFWATYYRNDGPIASQIELHPINRLCGALLQLPVKVMATYFTLYVLFPLYAAERRNWTFFFVRSRIHSLFWPFATLRQLLDHLPDLLSRRHAY